MGKEKFREKIEELKNILLENDAQIHPCDITDGTLKFVDKCAKKGGYSIVKSEGAFNTLDVAPEKALILASFPFEGKPSEGIPKKIIKSDKK